MTITLVELNPTERSLSLLTKDWYKAYKVNSACKAMFLRYKVSKISLDFFPKCINRKFVG